MNKFTVSYLSLSALMFSLLPGVSMAADIEAGIVKNIPENQVIPEIAGERLNLSEIDFSKHTEKPAQSLEKSSASGVSSYEVIAVGSSNIGGWESIAAWQGTTNYNHGGSILLVAVLQYGYGNPNQANMNGISKSHYSSQALCGALATIHYCGVGETITGWLYYYNFSGQQYGNFVTSTNSVAWPFGYWSDSIYIQ